MEQHWEYHATRSRKAADTDSASVEVEWNSLLENSTQQASSWTVLENGVQATG